MVEDGKLIQIGQRYFLPSEEPPRTCREPFFTDPVLGSVFFYGPAEKYYESHDGKTWDMGRVVCRFSIELKGSKNDRQRGFFPLNWACERRMESLFRHRYGFRLATVCAPETADRMTFAKTWRLFTAKSLKEENPL